MKIRLYTQEGCTHCTEVKGILAKMLPEFGLEYSTAVSEIDIDDSAVLADLIMMGAHSVPVIVLGTSSLFGPPVLDRERIRSLIKSGLDSVNRPG